LVHSSHGPMDFRELRTGEVRRILLLGTWVNKSIKKGEGLRLGLVLGSACCARWRSRSLFGGADGHDPVGVHHAHRKQIPPLGFLRFTTFGTPLQ
jgi:hypothetical protein